VDAMHAALFIREMFHMHGSTSDVEPSAVPAPNRAIPGHDQTFLKSIIRRLFRMDA
jgi:hypothetical protein